MAVTAQMVKALRDKTGTGMMDCKKALSETGGDEEKAIVWLREKGLARAREKAGRAVSEGLIGSYIHSTGKIGVMVEVKCETDFVAKSDAFKELAKNVAMQIAAANPVCLAPEDLPPDMVEKEKEIFKNQALAEGKPEHIAEKIIEGRLKKYYKEVCLLDQPYIKDDKLSVRDLVGEAVAVLGENIQLGRFTRMALGEEG